MKKLIVLIGVIGCFNQVFGGGIITNGNQSSQYVRMLSRNASTSADAVYFNPAGLMRMDNGFYISLNNQTLLQTKTVESGFPLLNTGTYEGKLSVPVFPTGFLVFKRDRFALSFGFGPVNGGGSADYEKGLPSFEKDIAKLVPGLAGLGKLGKPVSGYNADISFSGESVYWGLQGGASFKINNVLSAYAGMRYVPAENKYTGHIRNIEVKVNGQFKNGATFLTGEVNPLLQGLAAQATGAASSVQPLIAGGAGSLTLAQVQGMNLLTAAQRSQLEAGVLNFGVSQAAVNQMNISQIQAAYTAGAAGLNTQVAALTGTAAALGNKEVDVKQTGTGYTPILGLNINPSKGWNIGIKYEFETSLTMINDTKVDGTGKFPDKTETGSDIPALFSVGVDHNLTDKFKLSMSFNSYHDKGVNWGNNIYGQPRTIDHNTWEVAIGGLYQMTNKFAVSAGFLHTEIEVSKQFLSDFSYYNPGDTFGAGIEWKASNRFTVDLGSIMTYYADVNKSFTDASVGSYTENYKKHNLGFAIGLGYHFGGMK